MVIKRLNEGKKTVLHSFLWVCGERQYRINVNIALTIDLLLLTSYIFYLRTTSKEITFQMQTEKELEDSLIQRHTNKCIRKSSLKNSHRPHRSCDVK